MNVDALVAPAWLGFKPYEPGKSIESLAAQAGFDPADICKLASNENPLPSSEMVRRAFMQSFDRLSRYPDGDGAPLKCALAEYLKLPPEVLALGTGSNGILDGIARLFLTPDQSALYSQYGFMIYKLAVQAQGATGIEVPALDWGHDLEAFSRAYAQVKGQRPRLVFLANPNNPTGTWFSHSALEKFLDSIDSEHTLVVLDEAYAEYCDGLPGYPDALALWSKHRNLIITRTFSKAWGLAALRVGYAIAHPEVARWLNTERAPFNVSGTGLEVAAAALSDPAYLQRVVAHNTEQLAALQHWLAKEEVEFIPSVGNFVTIKVPARLEAATVYQRLLAQGIIARPLTGYAMPQHLRITIGSKVDNKRLQDNLLAVMSA